VIRTLCLAATLAALAPAPARAQEALDEQYETWVGMFITGPIHGDLFTISDLHYRAWDDFSPHWVLIRLGVGLRLMDGMFAVLGYAWTPSWRARDAEGFTDEHRIWEQWQWEIRDAPSRFRFQLRTRLEQRFRTQIPLDVAVRLRQFLRLSIGIDRDERVWFVLWDELFFGLNDAGAGELREPYQRAGFDQNRLFVGWALQAVPGTLRFELGYFNQWIRRPGNPAGDAVNHTAMLNAFVSWR
jgi:hypothetical protein